MAAATAVIFHVAFSKQIPQRDGKKASANNNNNKFIPLAGVANAAAAAAAVVRLRFLSCAVGERKNTVFTKSNGT